MGYAVLLGSVNPSILIPDLLVPCHLLSLSIILLSQAEVTSALILASS